MNKMQQNLIHGSRLSPQQEHLWRAQQNRSIYRVQCSVSIKGELNGDVLYRAVQTLVKRHEILRTTFYCLPGMDLPIQVVRKDHDFSWRQINLTDLTTEQQRAYIDVF